MERVLKNNMVKETGERKGVKRKEKEAIKQKGTNIILLYFCRRNR